MIRQSGLGITPSAELERRILSLVTTGEEGSSYTEASDALRRQRNRRKHNRTGRIPEREAERDELRRKREDLAAQRRQLSEAEAQLQRLEAFQRQAEQSLRDAQRYAAVEHRRGLDALRAQAEEKDAALAALRLQAEAVYDESVEAQEAMLDAFPSLKKMYAAGDGNMAVFYLKNATAQFCSFSKEPHTVPF